MVITLRRQRDLESIGAIASTYNRISDVFGTSQQSVNTNPTSKTARAQSQKKPHPQYSDYGQKSQGLLQVGDDRPYHANAHGAPYYRRTMACPDDERWAQRRDSGRSGSARESHMSSFVSGDSNVWFKSPQQTMIRRSSQPRTDKNRTTSTSISVDGETH